VGSVIDKELGQHCTSLGYQQNEIRGSLSSISFSGGISVEIVLSHLIPHLSLVLCIGMKLQIVVVSKSLQKSKRPLESKRHAMPKFADLGKKDKMKYATCPFPNENVIILCIFANSTWDISTKSGGLGKSQIRKTIVFV